MLTQIDNVALVQVLQFLVLGFFVLIGCALVTARLRLPKNRLDPLWDVLLVVVLVIYAVGLKIYFST